MKKDDFEEQEIYSDKVVLGIDRKGVRYELADRVMSKVNKYMYEGKFVANLQPYKDKVRTFCQNPSGFVSNKVYDNNLTLVVDL